MTETAPAAGAAPAVATENNNPPPAAGAASPPPPAGQPPAAPTFYTKPEEFHMNFAEDQREFFKNKGVKDINGLGMMYRNLETMMGDPNSVIKIPGKDAKPEEIDATYKKWGRPEKPGEYKIELPKGADAGFSETMRPLLHAAGLNQRQVDTIINGNEQTPGWNKVMETISAAQATAEAKQIETDIGALKQKWGADFDKRWQDAKSAMTMIGVTADQINKYSGMQGFANMVEMFHMLREKGGFSKEAGLSGGSGQGGGQSGTAQEDANQKIAAFFADPAKVAGYRRGDPAITKEHDDLQRIKAGGKMYGEAA